MRAPMGGLLNRQMTIGLLATVASLGPTEPALAETAVITVTVRATVSARTALQVSDSTLRFNVLSSGGLPCEAALDFAAAARTHRSGEVVLTVEPAGSLQGPDGASDGAATVSLHRPAEQTLADGAPQIAERWIGSGTWLGRLTFALNGATRPGTYWLPLRLVLTAP